MTTVDISELVCPGCGDPVAATPPTGWPRAAGRRPEFSHLDGSVLCLDSRGRVGEPVEAAGERFALTPTAEAALRAAGGSP
jgi:hypothetical protein